ncbi:protoporphyrinogen oxidase [Aggregicoccus sp. 17bor-14]|uniref:protoporphyrinogen oxidase n=1 Tax=Myxococcaceae TaxID=31 RepID=UPI00129C10E3|nr:MULTISPECIES: protoporphyrinogen oxidase [Myxococcaceae]MBF5045748.1 protoporphyrinogen oxidase [Simulacricoccus sp. 17bor-14]MRI91484.1 protoporphyrinogen oxidase [Aggregicoccus sp. 17bor-14]
MRVVIIGGGISGLALAHGLRAAGAQVQVLEAGERLGGNIRTRAHEGFLTEDGPNSFLDKEPALRELIDALGLGARLRTASPAARARFLYTRGRLRALPASPPAFLTSDVLPLGARLRVLGEPFTRRAKGGPEQDESLGDFGRRHLGRTATRVLLGGMQAGIFAGDLEALSVAAVFPKMAALDREHRSLVLGALRTRRLQRALPGGAGTTPLSGAMCTFEGGLQTLVDALAAVLAPCVRLGARVESLAREGGGWRVQLADGEVVQAERVVLCVPAPAAAALLRPLDAALAEPLEAIPYAPVGVVHLGFAPGALAQPEGFGFLVPPEEGRPLLGCIHVSTVFPFRAPAGQVLLTCLLGGVGHPQVAQLPEEALVGLAREELQRLAGITAAPALQQVVRWPRAIPQYNVGHLARVARLEGALARWPGLRVSGNAVRGVGLADCVREAAVLARALAQEA